MSTDMLQSRHAFESSQKWMLRNLFQVWGGWGSARVPLSILSNRPRGVGAGRRFCGASWMHGEQCPELISLILWSVSVVNMRQFELWERFFARITARCWHPCTFTAAHPPLDPTRVELIIDVLRFQSELVL